MSIPSPIDTIIFDLDGTLIDSSPSILAGFSAALQAHKIAPKCALTAALIGPPLKITLGTISGSQDDSLLESLATSFKAYYDTEGYRLSGVFPGIPEMLSQLHQQGITLHIATNKRIHPTRLILDHLGWSAFFSSVYGLDSVNPAFANKGQMIRQQLIDQKIALDRAAYLGDRPEDGQAADANNLLFYGAQWGYAPFSEADTPKHWKLLHRPQDLFLNGRLH